MSKCFADRIFYCWNLLIWRCCWNSGKYQTTNNAYSIPRYWSRMMPTTNHLSNLQMIRWDSSCSFKIWKMMPKLWSIPHRTMLARYDGIDCRMNLLPITFRFSVEVFAGVAIAYLYEFWKSLAETRSRPCVLIVARRRWFWMQTRSTPNTFQFNRMRCQLRWHSRFETLRA